MGNSTWDPNAWSAYSSTRNLNSSSTTASQIYTNTSGAKSDYDPKNINVRESRDSAANPNSTPIIIALDGTGSMDRVLASAIKNLGSLFKEIIDRKPVSDPHIMAMMVGDVAAHDRYPLQATQFEADIKIATQLEELFVERGGGGNGSESYHLPLYFAATRTDCDAFAKGRKGFIFTIGDEGVPSALTADQVQRVFGNDEPFGENMTYAGLLQMVSDNYNVFHLRVQQGYSYKESQDKDWFNVLGERALPLDDIDKIAEVIVATLQVVGGVDVDTVADSFSGSTALTIRKAVAGLAKTGTNPGAVTRF